MERRVSIWSLGRNVRFWHQQSWALSLTLKILMMTQLRCVKWFVDVLYVNKSFQIVSRCRRGLCGLQYLLLTSLPSERWNSSLLESSRCSPKTSENPKSKSLLWRVKIMKCHPGINSNVSSRKHWWARTKIILTPLSGLWREKFCMGMGSQKKPGTVWVFLSKLYKTRFLSTIYACTVRQYSWRFWRPVTKLSWIPPLTPTRPPSWRLW